MAFGRAPGLQKPQMMPSSQQRSVGGQCCLGLVEQSLSVLHGLAACLKDLLESMQEGVHVIKVSRDGAGQGQQTLHRLVHRTLAAFPPRDIGRESLSLPVQDLPRDGASV